MYAKMLNFIQRSLTVRKICRVERSHLVNFCISLEKKHENCNISQYDLSLHKLSKMMHKCLRNARLFEKFQFYNSKMADSRRH